MISLVFNPDTFNVPAMDLAIQFVISVRQGHRWCRFRIITVLDGLKNLSCPCLSDTLNLATTHTIDEQCLPLEFGDSDSSSFR